MSCLHKSVLTYIFCFFVFSCRFMIGNSLQCYMCNGTSLSRCATSPISSQNQTCQGPNATCVETYQRLGNLGNSSSSVRRFCSDSPDSYCSTFLEASNQQSNNTEKFCKICNVDFCNSNRLTALAFNWNLLLRPLLTVYPWF